MPLYGESFTFPVVILDNQSSCITYSLKGANYKFTLIMKIHIHNKRASVCLASKLQFKVIQSFLLKHPVFTYFLQNLFFGSLSGVNLYLRCKSNVDECSSFRWCCLLNNEMKDEITERERIKLSNITGLLPQMGKGGGSKNLPFCTIFVKTLIFCGFCFPVLNYYLGTPP